ncbi:hypothetical protein BV25DRAFT_1990407 [Artomyces pyxidatus]|uniref:Uncharacterized protein n=1 Tax=Artomyces pyxidatus TaxID=48021 RepID=A0ACB8T7A1_9AGAM|nr:hypothetical protein BV25DRAFT_1990407 [Artomyces pyxidatus]
MFTGKGDTLAFHPYYLMALELAAFSSELGLNIHPSIFTMPPGNYSSSKEAMAVTRSRVEAALNAPKERVAENQGAAANGDLDSSSPPSLPNSPFKDLNPKRTAALLQLPNMRLQTLRGHAGQAAASTSSAPPQNLAISGLDLQEMTPMLPLLSSPPREFDSFPSATAQRRVDNNKGRTRPR